MQFNLQNRTLPSPTEYSADHDGSGTGKPLEEVISCRPISLPPVTSKIFEKVMLNGLHPILEENGILPDYRSGFRQQSSTIKEEHQITEIIE
jgi:hypothetical protein